MKISVAMCTYNGERFLAEQLDCIRTQTRRPDEVVIIDDGSSDRTAEIVREYIASHGLDGWHFTQNGENAGYPENFYRAMGRCTGDIVFLADQDDVWKREKIERMAGVLAKRDERKLLCCSFGLIDGSGKEIRSVMAPTPQSGTGAIEAVSIGQVFYKCEWPGMTLAYKNEWYRDRCAEAGRDGNGRVQREIPHDLYLSALAAESDGFFRLRETLCFHRRHDANAGGEEHRIGRLLDKSRKVKEIEDYLAILACMEEEGVFSTERGRRALDEKSVSMKDRYGALLSGKISRVVKNAVKHRDSVRPATALCDVLIVRQR